MKFYNRENELKLLAEADKNKYKQGIMTMIIGRRRVGKTALSLQNYTNDIQLYFFVSKKDESLLCEEFLEEIKTKLNSTPIGDINSFVKLFEYLLQLGKEKAFTIIIDEFQEFLRINPSIYSSIQKLWDLNKAECKIHFIGCGSIYSLMKKIYEDKSEPLFGRADYKIDLQPLKIPVLSEILKDYNKNNNSNLLDFYLLTGGIAKYVELFILYDVFELESIIEKIISPNSLFLEEGRSRLIEEFGKEYATYFSILSLISSSKTSKSEIESQLNRNISGHLHRLEKDYSIIKSIKPINAKPNSKIQKYQISDNFLSFWFRFIYKYQSLVEVENFERLKEIIYRDINTYKGPFLEKLFIELLKGKNKYTKIGSYWERGNINEIDIVAVDELDKEILICEVKLSSKRLDLQVLKKKSQKLLQQFSNYKVEYRLLSIDNISDYV